MGNELVNNGFDRDFIDREYRKNIINACLMQDTFFRICLKERPDVIRLMLRLILSDPELEILDYKTQDDMLNAPYRSLEIDVYARNAVNGTRYNIEIQKGNLDNIPKRARYHSAILDTRGGLKPGEDFDKLIDNIVIFICSDDILEKGKAVYVFNRMTDEGIPLNDGATIVLLNCSFKGNHPLRQLIDDLNETSIDKINYKEISDAVRIAKEDVKEDMGMKDLFEDSYEFAREMGTRAGHERGVKEGHELGVKEGHERGVKEGHERGVKEGHEQGVKEGHEQASIEAAKKMLSSGKLSIDDIAEFTSLPVETIKKLAG